MLIINRVKLVIIHMQVGKLTFLISLLIFVSATFANAKSTLPTCPGSPSSDYDLSRTWSDCFGEVTIGKGFFRGEYKNGKRHGYCFYQELGRYKMDAHSEDLYCGRKLFKKSSYNKNLCESYRTVKFEGECKYGKYEGYGERTLRDGTVLKGMFSGGFFKYEMAKPTTKSSKLSPQVKRQQTILEKRFKQMNKPEREIIQIQLKNLGFYSGKIDGLYGKATEKAIRKYNITFQNKLDLTKRINVNKIYDDILGSTKTLAVENPTKPLNLADEKPIQDNLIPDSGGGSLKESVTIDQLRLVFDDNDFSEALELSKLLAVEGDAEAQLILGKLYSQGLGTLQLNKNAHMWFNISAHNGNSEALNERNSISQIMTASAVEEAQALAQKCLESGYKDCGFLKSTAPRNLKVVSQQDLSPPEGEIREEFVSSSQTKRKQIQYALRSFGFYNNSIDGLWGMGTKNALNEYIDTRQVYSKSVKEIFETMLNEVDVPMSFPNSSRSENAKVIQKSPRTSNSAGLTAISERPSVSGEQAKAICEPMARLAASEAASRSKSTIKCSSRTDYFGKVQTRCRETDDNGFPGLLPLILETDPASQAKRESERVYNAKINSCLAQYGWKK